MAFQSLQIRPGITEQITAALNESGYSDGSFVRFKDWLAEKQGGWQAVTNTPLIGTARGSHVWADLSGNPYYEAGSEQPPGGSVGRSVAARPPSPASPN